MAVTEEIMLKVENVSKVYKLGEIGGTTLRDELQRLGAKIRHKPDPTKKVGAKDYNKGEKFKALDNVSFEVKKGERIGIIGHNGAGKSTLLKLISRVTGPTSGNIYMNGRVASMLEVGTGFHPELTGRENVYMNGAILGMTKKEIDAKMEDIIEFSEVRQFIDTPVKRYSSGMYVKLAFSVAAHLNSEIMIMDEVLAVGDMAFQNKCIQKMKSVSEEDDKTILYVSHNMSTIRQLCDRVIVLKEGKIVFNGDVDEGISVYSGSGLETASFISLEQIERENGFKNLPVKMTRLQCLESLPAFNQGDAIDFKLDVYSVKNYDNVILSVFIECSGTYITTMMSDPIIRLEKNKDSSLLFKINLENLAPGFFNVKLLLSLRDNDGRVEYLDMVTNCFPFRIVQQKDILYGREWSLRYNGFFVGPKVIVEQ